MGIVWLYFNQAIFAKKNPFLSGVMKGQMPYPKSNFKFIFTLIAFLFDHKN